MKHLLTLIAALVFVSASLKADDRNKSDKNKSQVALAPFVWGSPADDAPAELIADNNKMKMAAAPFIWGNADETPEVLGNDKCKNTLVPVAPFTYGNPDDEIVFESPTPL